MDISKIPAGKKPPEDVNIVIEIPMMSDPIKYEFCKESGAIVVDRIQNVAMYYPANYGFIPGTLGGDGDSVDALLVCGYKLAPGCVINARPIGVIMMEDEGGMDEKIIAVPSSKVAKKFDKIQDISDLDQDIVSSIKHFFEHYKDLEPGKWVKISSIEGAEVARRVIKDSIK